MCGRVGGQYDVPWGDLLLQRFMEEEASKKKSNFSVKIQFDVVKSLNLLN